MTPPTPPNYWDYLKLAPLLELQGGLEEDESTVGSDELHFIVVHQVYELWFKLILRELRLARDHLAVPRVDEKMVPLVVHHLGRVNSILKLAGDQFRVMETLTPQDFLDFRDKLIPSSGFQSFQMREIEILLGLDDSQRVKIGGIDPLAHIERVAKATAAGQKLWTRIEKVQQEKTLRSALHDWLHRTPIQGSTPTDAGDERAVVGFLEDYMGAYERLQREQTERLIITGAGEAEHVRQRMQRGLEQTREFLFAMDVPEERRLFLRRVRAGILFIESYRDVPLLAWPRLLVDTIVEMEEMLVMWRTRHARMVERMVGRRVGTGGSPGVAYLDETAAYRVFVELWSVRTALLPRRALPQLSDPEFYGFAR